MGTWVHTYICTCVCMYIHTSTTFCIEVHALDLFAQKWNFLRKYLSTILITKMSCMSDLIINISPPHYKEIFHVKSLSQFEPCINTNQVILIPYYENIDHDLHANPFLDHIIKDVDLHLVVVYHFTRSRLMIHFLITHFSNRANNKDLCYSF